MAEFWIQWFMGAILILSSLGVILLKKPVHACLSFLLSLLLVAFFYLKLSAQFISIMQVLVYAGAILVLFMFVILLFQDAYKQIAKKEAGTSRWFLYSAALLFLGTTVYLWLHLIDLEKSFPPSFVGYGTVQSLGYALYLDFFFPFEAVVFVFLIALIGAVYIGRRT